MYIYQKEKQKPANITLYLMAAILKKLENN